MREGRRMKGARGREGRKEQGGRKEGASGREGRKEKKGKEESEGRERKEGQMEGGKKNERSKRERRKEGRNKGEGRSKRKGRQEGRKMRKGQRGEERKEARKEGRDKKTLRGRSYLELRRNFLTIEINCSQLISVTTCLWKLGVLQHKKRPDSHLSETVYIRPPRSLPALFFHYSVLSPSPPPPRSLWHLCDVIRERGLLLLAVHHPSSPHLITRREQRLVYQDKLRRRWGCCSQELQLGWRPAAGGRGGFGAAWQDP
ncbi:Octapeptide-repeat protein T2, partial [Ophiophagus hannah]